MGKRVCLPSILSVIVLTGFGLPQQQAGGVFTVQRHTPSQSKAEILRWREDHQKTIQALLQALNDIDESRRNFINAREGCLIDLLEEARQGMSGHEARKRLAKHMLGRAHAARDYGNQEWSIIVTLGELRAAEAVNPLFERIDARFVRLTGIEHPPDSEVVRALINIGKPASRRAIELLAADPSELVARLYVRVIVGVEGQALGRAALLLAIEVEREPGRKAALRRGLALLEASEVSAP